MPLQPVRDPVSGKVLFRYDAERDLVEIKNDDTRRRVRLVDLREFKDTPPPGQVSPDR